MSEQPNEQSARGAGTSAVAMLSQSRERDNTLKAVGAALALAFLALLVCSVWVFPAWIVAHDRGGETISPAELVKAKNAARTTLLQGLGGAFFLVTAFFTWRQLRNSQQLLEVNWRELAASEERQLSERVGRAIDQVGHDDLAVRVGGIYSLERIAQRSSRDYRAIMDVLTAYVRVRASWPRDDLPGGVRADIQAVLAVLKRRNREYETPDERLDLSSTDLRRSSLDGVHFERAKLDQSHFEDADLRGAHLEAAELTKAVLDRADLRGAILSDADLSEASLVDANVVGVVDVGTEWPEEFDRRRTQAEPLEPLKLSEGMEESTREL